MMVRIEREDMLELTRRMTPSRNCFGRVAGDYRDEEGEDDGSFNTFFLSLKPADRDKQLSIAKAIPYSKTNEELKAYDFNDSSKRMLEMKRLLTAIKDSELKNDAMLDTFYDVIADGYINTEEYGIYLYHGTYDIPVKAKDKEWLEGSEEVYSFIICALCPVDDGFNPLEPTCGFLYPAFMNRSADPNRIAVYINEKSPNDDLLHILGI